MQIKKGNSYSLAAVCDNNYFFYHDNVAHVKDLKISQFLSYLSSHLASTESKSISELFRIPNSSVCWNNTK